MVFPLILNVKGLVKVLKNLDNLIPDKSKLWSFTVTSLKGATTFSIKTLTIKGLYVTLSINNTEHN